MLITMRTAKYCVRRRSARVDNLRMRRVCEDLHFHSPLRSEVVSYNLCPVGLEYELDSMFVCLHIVSGDSICGGDGGDLLRMSQKCS